MTNDLLKYVLRRADSELVLGHRMSEWCGHGPELEEDIALINISLDHLGQSRSLYQYAAAVDGEAKTEDHYAFQRNERDFGNFLICELPNGHYGNTIARSFFYDVHSLLFYERLVHSADKTLAAIAEKSLKEVKYHFRHSAEWVIRLGDGTEESHAKMQEAIDEIWTYTGELLTDDELDIEMNKQGIGVLNSSLKDAWYNKVEAVLNEATLKIPEGAYFQTGGKSGIHTEHLGYLLAEMQYLPRQHPEATW